MHLDHYNYHRYTGPAKLEKSINSLIEQQFLHAFIIY